MAFPFRYAQEGETSAEGLSLWQGPGGSFINQSMKEANYSVTLLSICQPLVLLNDVSQYINLVYYGYRKRARPLPLRREIWKLLTLSTFLCLSMWRITNEGSLSLLTVRRIGVFSLFMPLKLRSAAQFTQDRFAK